MFSKIRKKQFKQIQKHIKAKYNKNNLLKLKNIHIHKQL